MLLPSKYHMLVYKGYRFKVIRETIETITRQLFCAFRLMCDLNSIRLFCVLLQNTKLPRNKYCPNICKEPAASFAYIRLWCHKCFIVYEEFCIENIFQCKKSNNRWDKIEDFLGDNVLHYSRSKQFSLG